jgi:hypothetical protein
MASARVGASFNTSRTLGLRTSVSLDAVPERLHIHGSGRQGFVPFLRHADDARADPSCSFPALVIQPEPFGPYAVGLFLG